MKTKKQPPTVEEIKRKIEVLKEMGTTAALEYAESLEKDLNDGNSILNWYIIK